MERIVARLPRLQPSPARHLRTQIRLQRIRKPSHLHRTQHIRPSSWLLRRKRDSNGHQEVQGNGPRLPDGAFPA